MIMDLNGYMNPPRNPWKEPIQPIGHRVNLIPMVIVILFNFVIVFIIVIVFFVIVYLNSFFMGPLPLDT